MKRTTLFLAAFALLANRAQAEVPMGLLSVHIADQEGRPVSGMVVDVLRNTLPTRAIDPDRPVSIPAGRYQLQAANRLRGGDSENRAMSYPITVVVAEGDLTSVVLPVQTVGDDRHANAIITSMLHPK